jgi:bifunctional non-homologous end joining protein LigD
LSNPDWAYEPKLDGYRVIAIVNERGAELRSRGGHDFTQRFRSVADDLSQQTHRPLVLDGELVGFAEGAPSFGALQGTRTRRRASTIAQTPAVEFTFYAFDILHALGIDLRGATYTQRRELLEQLIVPSTRVNLVHAVDDGEDLFAATLRLGFEGIIAKRRSSRYRPGIRTSDWLKFKHASFRR